MSHKELQKIKREFSRLHLNPIYLEHEPVITSEDAAKTRGFELKQGIKAIVLTNDSEFVVVDVPGDKKVDVKKVAEKLNWQKGKIRMATHEEVLEKTGCEIGAVPPFGHKMKLKILADGKIYDNEESAFNIGLRTHSAKVSTREIKIIFGYAGAEDGDFSKN